MHHYLWRKTPTGLQVIGGVGGQLANVAVALDGKRGRWYIVPDELLKEWWHLPDQLWYDVRHRIRCSMGWPTRRDAVKAAWRDHTFYAVSWHYLIKRGSDAATGNG